MTNTTTFKSGSDTTPEETPVTGKRQASSKGHTAVVSGVAIMMVGGAVGEGDGVAVGVGVGVGVAIGVGVGVPVGVGVGGLVGVGVSVDVGVRVLVGVGVKVGVSRGFTLKLAFLVVVPEALLTSTVTVSTPVVSGAV